MVDFLLQNDFLLSVIAFGLILIPAIIVHELGHFFAAKLVGINVLEFGIGFPPRMVRLFSWGETEFTLNWLPIGGFVRPLGEDMVGPLDPDAEDDEKQDGDKPKNAYYSEREELINRGVPEDKLLSVNEAKPLPRIFFMVAGALANFATAIALFIVVALIGLPEFIGARLQVAEVPVTSSLSQMGVETGDVIEQINGEYFASPADYFTRLNENANETVVLSIRDFDSGEAYEVRYVPSVGDITARILVTGVESGSPADNGGLIAGDLILRINGEPLSTDDPLAQLQSITTANAGREIMLTISREGEIREMNLIPRAEVAENQGRIGITIQGQRVDAEGVAYARTLDQEALVPQELGPAVAHGFRQTGETIALIVSIPNQLIQGTITPEQARPVSFVGISRIGAAFLQQSIDQGTPTIILNLIALVSIFLGFTNLLPIPPLDGGRVVFAIIEMIRGRPVSPRIEGLVMRIGIAFILGLAVLVIIYDIIDPIVIPG